jgi:hypothetical protein
LCCDVDHEGNIDFAEFTGRFLDPAKEIGFNLAILLTNLSEHMRNDPRLAKFLESAGTVLNFFEPFLGRIEIKTADKVSYKFQSSSSVPYKFGLFRAIMAYNFGLFLIK